MLCHSYYIDMQDITIVQRYASGSQNLQLSLDRKSQGNLSLNSIPLFQILSDFLILCTITFSTSIQGLSWCGAKGHIEDEYCSASRSGLATWKAANWRLLRNSVMESLCSGGPLKRYFTGVVAKLLYGCLVMCIVWLQQ